MEMKEIDNKISLYIDNAFEAEERRRMEQNDLNGMEWSYNNALN